MDQATPNNGVPSHERKIKKVRLALLRRLLSLEVETVPIMGLVGEAVAATEMDFQVQRAEEVEAAEAEPGAVPVGAVASEALVSTIA